MWFRSILINPPSCQARNRRFTHSRVVPIRFPISRWDLTSTRNPSADLFQWRIANRTRFGDDQHRLEITASYTYQELDFPIVFVVDGVLEHYGGDLRFVWETPLLKQIRRLMLGLGVWQGDGDDDRFLNVGGGRGPQLGRNHSNARNVDLYGELEFALLPDLTLLAGAQWSKALREVEDRFPADGELHFDKTAPQQNLWVKLGSGKAPST